MFEGNTEGVTFDIVHDIGCAAKHDQAKQYTAGWPYAGQPMCAEPYAPGARGGCQARDVLDQIPDLTGNGAGWARPLAGQAAPDGLRSATKVGSPCDADGALPGDHYGHSRWYCDPRRLAKCAVDTPHLGRHRTHPGIRSATSSGSPWWPHRRHPRQHLFVQHRVSTLVNA